VRLGLEWLAAMGHISFISNVEKSDQASFFGENVDKLKIAPGGEMDSPQAVVLLEQIQTMLEETRAFRAYFIHRYPLELIA
jgi:hypothetical protein